MTIVAADLKLFASEFPLDVFYGGGRMTASVVQNGVENNLFPDIDAGARANGRVQLRKMYAAVVSANDDSLAGAQLDLNLAPADSAVGVVAFQFGDQTTTRAAAAELLAATVTGTLSLPLSGGGTITYASLPNSPYVTDTFAGTLTARTSPSEMGHATTGTPLGVGTLIGREDQVARLYSLGATVGQYIPSPTLASIAHVVSVAGASGAYVYTMSEPMNFGPQGGGADPAWYVLRVNPSASRCVGTKLATVASTASAITVSGVEARVTPNITPYPLVVNGIDPTRGLRSNRGRVPIFRPGEGVVLRNGVTTEIATVLSVGYHGVLTFIAPLVNIYPIGTTVSSLLPLGDMQAVVGISFAQQTWTRLFTDAIVGNTTSANYNRVAFPITTTNLGAAPDRYALVFTSSTEFKLFSEQFGQIASGNITTAFLPLNPLTSTPLFTIPSGGWGSGWGVGNVFRLNTIGARAPIWVARTVSPSAPGGLDGSTWVLRGSVNA